MTQRKSGQGKRSPASPFARLKGLAAAQPNGESRAPQTAPGSAPGDSPETDAHCFTAEMSLLGVQPLPSREIEGADGDNTRPAAQPPDRTTAEREIFLEAIGTLDTIFRDELPEDQPDAQPAGLARPRRLRQLARGRLRPQAELDLHGLTVAVADARAGLFLADASRRGLDCVLLITGKGLHSADGPVLRRAIERLLDKRRELVAEWGYAPQRLGGSGALAVFLRKRTSL